MTEALNDSLLAIKSQELLRTACVGDTKNYFANHDLYLVCEKLTLCQYIDHNTNFN